MSTSQRLKCPACATPMHPEVAGTLELDRCPGCLGLWFDSNELDAALMAATPAAQPAESAPDRGKSAWSCPRCWPERMRAVGWPMLVLDRCDHCRGFFLNAQELKALAENRGPLEAMHREQEVWSWLYATGSTALAGAALINLLIRLLR